MFLHKNFGPTEPPVLPAWPLLAWPVTIYWGVIKTKRPLMMVDPRPIINSTPPSLSKVWLDRSESTLLDFFDISSISIQYLGVLLFEVTTRKSSLSDLDHYWKQLFFIVKNLLLIDWDTNFWWWLTTEKWFQEAKTNQKNF